MLSVLERRRVCLIGSDWRPSSLGCGRLCLGEVRSDRGGGKEEESAEDGLGNEGVAEEHPSGLILRKAGPKGLSEAAPGFDVKWIEGPAQGVGEEVEDDGGGHGAEEDLAGPRIFEIAGEEDHGGESGEGDEKLCAPAIALHRTGEGIGEEPSKGGEDDASDAEQGHTAEEEGSERLEASKVLRVQRAENSGHSQNDDENNQRKRTLHGAETRRF